MTLYRRYRPQHFSELVGQDAVSLTLQQALRLERLAHAYLFSGPRGTGKTSTARIFARAISCIDPKGINKDGVYEPCNTCPACLAITENQTSDLVEIDAASNRGIEDIRELREQTSYRPLQLKKKIYIIDEVHMLTTEAFNALLKTLEEPPDYCLFILATTELHKVPLTIRSRCQLLRFERGNTNAIKKKLEQIIKSEKLEVEKGVSELLAEHADGGFRDAETLLETLSTQYNPLTLTQAEQALGVLPEKQVETLIETCLSGNAEDCLTLVQETTRPLSGSLERLLTQIINQLRKRLFTSSKQAPLIAYALNQFLEAYILQKSAPLPSLPLEIACLNTCTYAAGLETPPSQSATTPPEPQEKVVTPAKNVAIPMQVAPSPTVKASAPAQIITPKPASPNPSVPVVELRQEYISDPRKAWKLMIDSIAKENIALAQALKQTIFHTAEDGLITIHVRYKFHADKMQEKKNHLRIRSLLHELTEQEWEVVYQVSGTMPKHSPLKELAHGVEEVKAVFGEAANDK